MYIILTSSGRKLHLFLFVTVVIFCAHFQIVEQGVDDYADAQNYTIGSEGYRKPPLQPNGGQPAFTPPQQAGFDFDGFAGGNGGAQGTRRSLRLDGTFAGRATTASGVNARRPRAFEGVEHDLLGAWAATQAEQKLAGAAEVSAAATAAAAATSTAVLEANITARVACAGANANISTTSTSEQEACASATLALEVAVGQDSKAQAAATTAHALAVEASEILAGMSDAAKLYRGTHRPSRLSFYIKVNNSDSANLDVPYEQAGQRWRRGTSWGGLIALHSADYGQRTGFDARGTPSDSTLRESIFRNRTQSGEATTATPASLRSSSSSDPYEQFGYFAAPGADWSMGASSGAFGEPPPGGGLGGNFGAFKRPCPSGVQCPSDWGYHNGTYGAGGASSSSSSTFNENGTTTNQNYTNTTVDDQAQQQRRRDVIGERMPRVIVGVSVGADMRHGTDFLVLPDELLHPVAPASVDPLSAQRRTASGSAHASSSSDALGGMPVFQPHVQQRRWYKVDVFLDWRRGLYTVNHPRRLYCIEYEVPKHFLALSSTLLSTSTAQIFKAHSIHPHLFTFCSSCLFSLFIPSVNLKQIRVDDERMVHGASFDTNAHPSALKLGVYAHRSCTVWVDELYVGPDTSRQFETPVITGTGADMARPRQTNGWTADDIGGVDALHPMTRHESHLSRRRVHQFDSTLGPRAADYGSAPEADQHGGIRRLTPFDGDGHRKFHSDIANRRPRGFAQHAASVSDVESGFNGDGSGSSSTGHGSSVGGGIDGLGGHLGDGGSLGGSGRAQLQAGALLFVAGDRAGSAQASRAATSATQDVWSTANDGAVPREVNQNWLHSARDRASGRRGYLDGSTNQGEPQNRHRSGSTGRYYW